MIKYSICVCNYNMGNYIYIALSSVLSQLTNEFEVLVVDDGSTDNSISQLEILRNKFENFSYYSLGSNQKRMLGETRNISIEKARGKYVVLHIDADDIWEAGIVEWCKNAEELSKKFDDQVYISGQQINFVSKSFILSFGGYRNIYYTEDRDLWARLASFNKIIFIDHPVFRSRMKLARGFQIKKTLYVTWNILVNDIRTQKTIRDGIKSVLSNLTSNFKVRGFYGGMLRMIYMPVAFIFVTFLEPIPNFSCKLSHDEYIKYKKRNTKTFSEWLNLQNKRDASV